MADVIPMYCPYFSSSLESLCNIDEAKGPKPFSAGAVKVLDTTASGRCPLYDSAIENNTLHFPHVEYILEDKYDNNLV